MHVCHMTCMSYDTDICDVCDPCGLLLFDLQVFKGGSIGPDGLRQTMHLQLQTLAKPLVAMGLLTLHYCTVSATSYQTVRKLQSNVQIEPQQCSTSGAPTRCWLQTRSCVNSILGSAQLSNTVSTAGPDQACAPYDILRRKSRQCNHCTTVTGLLA